MIFRKHNEYSELIAGGIKSKSDESQIPEDHSFDAGIRMNMQPVVNFILNKIMIPWLVKCLEKYPEAEFHRRMSWTYYADGQKYDGFDFLEDWYIFHPRKFQLFLKLARKERKNIIFDIDDQLKRLVYILTKHGWTIQPKERNSLRQVIQRLYNMIYSHSTSSSTSSSS